MRTKYFLLLFLLLLGAGCATSQYGSEATAVLEEGEPSIADTTFLYDSRVIALETKDDALIARVNRLIEWKGNLYILDKAGKQVVAFNMRLSQNTLRWPLLFHSKLKSFGFFSKDEFISLLLKISLFFLLP